MLTSKRLQVLIVANKISWWASLDILASELAYGVDQMWWAYMVVCFLIQHPKKFFEGLKMETDILLHDIEILSFYCYINYLCPQF